MDTIELSPIASEKKEDLKKMLLEYFKEIDDSKIVYTKAGEEIEYPFLDLYWKETKRIPLNILWNNEIIGFILINDWIVYKEFEADKSIAELYIKPDFRRKGIGKKVTYKLFNKYKGKWEIRQSSTNYLAVKFWRSIIKEFTNGNFKEIENSTEDTIEFVQLFES